MSETDSGPANQANNSAAETSQTQDPPPTQNPAETEHPVGEKQAQRNTQQEPRG